MREETWREASREKTWREISRETWRPVQAALAPRRSSIEALAKTALGDVRVTAIAPVRGGLVNANFRIELAGPSAPPAALLRYWRRGLEHAQKEIALLAFFAGRLPVPAILASGAADPEFGLPYAFMRWIEGDDLGAVTRRLPAAWHARLGAQVGESLAGIHAVVFERQGFFGADLVPRGDFDMDVEGQIAWLDHCLDAGAARERLGAVAERLPSFVARKGHVLCSDWARRPTLTHADFDASNILMRRRADAKITAILDWEFAFAGGPSFDLGHLLRPPLGDDPTFIDAVCAGYRAAGGELPEEWEEAAQMADLLSWVDFASQPFCGPEAAASARMMIERLMASLAGT